ncbi:MAG: hypothetical protein JW917_03620 [Ignavibacteria bacterium]|nr:hypothetical protein [Ignavibacteria bacterium]
MKKHIILVTIFLLIITILISVLKTTENKKVIYSKDTIIFTDTIFVKYEKVIPKRIYVYKTDTIRIIKEVIEKIEKKRDEITIISQNENDSAIKKYELKNIYRDFVLHSDSSGISLYRKNSGWDGVRLKAGLNNLNFRDSMKSKLYVGVETGVYYKRLQINTGLNYFPVNNKYGIDIDVSFLIR